MTASQRDILYCEGSGDIVAVYEAWKRRQDYLNETSLTYSAQLFEACQREGMTVHAVSHCARRASVCDARYTVANLPRWACRLPRIGYDITLFVYTLRLALLALRIRARIVMYDHGVTEPRYAFLFRLAGAQVVPVLHNTLWPLNTEPNGWSNLRSRLDRLFLRRASGPTLAVSPAAARQAHAAGATVVSVFQPSFPQAGFQQPPALPDFNARPFNVLFAGRMEADKGVFDILEMSERLGPDTTFTLCGTGSRLEQVRQAVVERGLQDRVFVKGHLDRPQLLREYRAAHAVIVPTRSSFSEGYCKVVAEAILLGRPVITSPVVPAAETLGAAIALARTDDVDSYVGQIRRLATDRAYHARLSNNVQRLRPGLLDESMSFLSVVRRTIGEMMREATAASRPVAEGAGATRAPIENSAN